MDIKSVLDERVIDLNMTNPNPNSNPNPNRCGRCLWFTVDRDFQARPLSHGFTERWFFVCVAQWLESCALKRGTLGGPGSNPGAGKWAVVA